MKFLANENIPITVCARLRLEEKIDIVSILDISKGAKDKDVLLSAQSEDRIIVTFDKDFGELVFRKKAKVKGIILLRFTPKSPEFILNKIKDAILKKEIRIEGRFVIVEEERVRIREIK